MAKRLATWFFSLIRWMSRQALMSLLIVVGAVVGWFGRKATGPALVSEQVQVRSVVRTSGRPAPVVPVDPAARSWLEDATTLSSPSSSLLKLRRQLEAGEISDFGRLARALLCHPLPLFRREALSALVAAWGREEPAAAMTFLLEHKLELEAHEEVNSRARRPGETEQQFVRIAHSWAGKDPLGAMTFLTPEVCGKMEESWEDLITMAFEPGSDNTPGLIERIHHLRSLYGESALNNLKIHAFYYPAEGTWAKAGRAPSADDWRTLAASTTHDMVKSQFLNVAMQMWQHEKGGTASADGLRAWLGDSLPPSVEADLIFRSKDPQAMAAFLRSTQAQELPDSYRGYQFQRLVQTDPALARELVRDGVVTGMPSFAASLQMRGESDLQAWLQALPEPAQREEFLRSWTRATWQSTDRVKLEADVARALSYGPEGDVLAVGRLGQQAGMAAGEMLDVFANLAPDVQARTRMDLVLEVGKHAPDVAAELWMDATPEELAQPGAGAVAEEVAARLLRRDPEVASAWIQQLPPGESRDRAVARMIERTATADPTTGAEWAATLVDPIAQQRARNALERAATKNARR